MLKCTAFRRHLITSCCPADAVLLHVGGQCRQHLASVVESSSAPVGSAVHLVLGMCCQQVKGSNGKVELARVGELADLLSKGH